MKNLKKNQAALLLSSTLLAMSNEPNSKKRQQKAAFIANLFANGNNKDGLLHICEGLSILAEEEDSNDDSIGGSLVKGLEDDLEPSIEIEDDDDDDDDDIGIDDDDIGIDDDEGEDVLDTVKEDMMEKLKQTYNQSTSAIDKKTLASLFSELKNM